MDERRVNRLCCVAAGLVMIFLLAPLVVIVIASFTPTAIITFPPQGFSLKWYANIFHSSTHFMDGLVNSLKLGLLATVLDVFLGVTAALSVCRYDFKGKNALLNYFTSPMYVPSVAFVAVPAEEYVELEYRQRLRQEGKIHFIGGKQEYIRLGVLDDVDMGMMIHSHAGVGDRHFLIGCDSSGFVGKLIRFTGKEAHAGARPFDGINALNAACLSLLAVNSQRETFREKDRIRIHPIMTKGGDLVNIVPADVRLETYVRGTNLEGILDASEKVNRCLQGCAYAIGASVDIQELPGYLPLIQDPRLSELFALNGEALLGQGSSIYGQELMGATDAGDISSIMPFIHMSTGGYLGDAHSKDFTICDKEMAYVMPAKAMALTVIDLLWDHAAEARQIKERFSPKFDREGYLRFWEQFESGKVDRSCF